MIYRQVFAGSCGLTAVRSCKFSLRAFELVRDKLSYVYTVYDKIHRLALLRIYSDEIQFHLNSADYVFIYDVV